MNKFFKKENFASLSWSHSRHAVLDPWTIVHTLWGVVLGVGFSILLNSFWQGFIFSLIIIVLWETFEYLLKIIETPQNVLSDIAFGMFGFTVGFLWQLNAAQSWRALLGIATLALVIQYFGWRAWRKRTRINS